MALCSWPSAVFYDSNYLLEGNDKQFFFYNSCQAIIDPLDAHVDIIRQKVYSKVVSHHHI